MNSFKLKINHKFKNTTILELLSSFYLGKDKIKEFLKCLYVNTNIVDENYVLNEDDVFEIKLNEKIDLRMIDLPLDVLYEDDYFLFVNKPRNILIHSDGSDEIVLNQIVANYYKIHHIRRKIRACNRLDYATSGIVVYAKDSISEAYMNYLIRERKVEKKYYAVCYNRFSKKDATINLPIARDRHNSKKMRVSKTGKESLTKYTVLKNGIFSLCDITLITGRTHQIRVHFAYLNHPLVGDDLYGKDKGDLCLQAYGFTCFNIFTNKEISLKIEIENYLIERIKQ